MASPSRPTLVTYSNMGYFPYARNLLLNLSANARHHTLHFYCLDTEIMAALKKLNIHNIQITFELVPTAVSKRLETYGSPGYNKITHMKMLLLKEALAKYKFIHFIDCDVVCVKEPAEDYWAKYAEYDVVFQYDAGFHSADNPHWPEFHTWTCTGNTTFRDTPGTHRLIDKILEYQGRYPNKNDQECLYEYFKDLGLKSIRDTPIANLYQYPAREFTNGYWVKHNIGSLADTYFFHANHCVGNEKIPLLQKAGFWFP